MINAIIQIAVIMRSNGIINFIQVFKLIFTMARLGSIKPVGAMKDMIHIPYIYEFTISLPGIFTIIANAPMIGIVNTAMPDVDCIKSEKKI
jgi:hypothetical protein